MSLQFVKASTSDALTLNGISKRAFDSDVQVGAPSAGGNDAFYDMIFKRKSFHIFRNVGDESISENELDEIQKAYSVFAPLYPHIKTDIRICPGRPD